MKSVFLSCFILLTRGWGRLETGRLIALGSSPELSTFTTYGSPVCVLFCFVDSYRWSVESRLIRTALPQLQFVDIVESLVFYIN